MGGPSRAIVSGSSTIGGPDAGKARNFPTTVPRCGSRRIARPGCRWCSAACSRSARGTGPGDGPSHHGRPSGPAPAGASGGQPGEMLDDPDARDGRVDRPERPTDLGRGVGLHVPDVEMARCTVHEQQDTRPRLATTPAAIRRRSCVGQCRQPQSAELDGRTAEKSEPQRICSRAACTSALTSNASGWRRTDRTHGATSRQA